MAFATEGEDSKPWQRPSPVSARIAGPLPESLTPVLSNQIFIVKSDLPQPLANRLIRLATFQNPEFYKAQAMRLSVWNKPRIIGCAKHYPQHIGLPRSCLGAVLDLLQENGIHPELQDERQPGRRVAAKFTGTLRKDQKTAVREMLKHEIGVLCAPTAFGNTVHRRCPDRPTQGEHAGAGTPHSTTAPVAGEVDWIPGNSQRRTGCHRRRQEEAIWQNRHRCYAIALTPGEFG